MRIAIVGWGIDGKSAYNFFGPEHDYLIVNEEPADDFPPESDRVKVQFINKPRTPGITSNVEDWSYLEGIENCDKIVYSVTASKVLEKLFKDNQDFWLKATTAPQIFFDEVKTKNIIGVTGTKGKGTTSTLIAKMLEADGKKVWLGGNIGRGFLDFLRDVHPDDWVVLELANFQLYHLRKSPRIGVCLMISEEHLDWHPDMTDYVQAKSHLFRYQTGEDVAIYMSGNRYSEEIVGYSKGIKIPYGASPGAQVRDEGVIVIGEEETEIIKTSQLKLIGHHNWQNVCAAVTAVWQVTQNVEAIRQVLATFSGLEHRLEFVRELNNVKYYDDSFGTHPDTTIVALRAFVQPAVLILGGHDKGLSYDKLIDEIVHKDRVRHIITIGQIGPALAKMLREKHFTAITEGLEKMPNIVAEARKQAQPGDVVLLSCGTSSFGLFKDYKDRGNQFKQAVQALS